MASEAFDVVVVGTPPDTHIKLALQQLDAAAPRVLLIEKPLCAPDLVGCNELMKAAEAAMSWVAKYSRKSVNSLNLRVMTSRMITPINGISSHAESLPIRDMNRSIALLATISAFMRSSCRPFPRRDTARERAAWRCHSSSWNLVEVR